MKQESEEWGGHRQILNELEILERKHDFLAKLKLPKSNLKI